MDYPKIILMSGTPGTGKTTVTEILCEDKKFVNFNLGKFLVENSLFEKEDEIRDTKIIDPDIAGYKGSLKLTEIILQTIKELDKAEYTNYQFIVDSHYSDIIIDGFTSLREKIIKNNEFGWSKREIHFLSSYFNEILNAKHVFGIILRCEPFELQSRLLLRKYSKGKVSENIQAEILGESSVNMIEVLQEEQIFEVMTHQKSPETVVEEIKSIIDAEKAGFDKNIGMNWLRSDLGDEYMRKFFKEDYGERRKLQIDSNGDIISNDKGDGSK